TNVRCLGDLRPIDPLAAIPNLTTLELVQNEVVRDLSPLATCPHLRDLRLTHCQLIRDLSPLARTTIEHLQLHFLLPPHLATPAATLAGAGLRARPIRNRRPNTGLHPLPADLPLTELTIDNTEHDRNLTGITRWPTLTQVTATGVPTAAELTELAVLPQLHT